MKSTAIFNLATCLALAQAVPTALRARYAPLIDVTFNGAAGAGYTLTVPLDGSVVQTNNALSISTITSSYDIQSFCTLQTVDFPPALVQGPPGTFAVGPPQTVISISCNTGGDTPPPPPASIVIDFVGAADAKYELTVPLDGSFVATNNALSISTLQSSFANLASACTFQYIDGSAALVKIAADTWAVGPPQTINGVSCSSY